MVEAYESTRGYSEMDFAVEDLTVAPRAAQNPLVEDNAIYIDEVLDRALMARTRELPGNYPFVVQEAFISRFTQKWSQPARVLCRTIHAMLSKLLRNLVADHFASFGQGNLEKRVQLIIQDHIKKRVQSTEAYIDWLVRLEDRPFTLNTHYLADYRDKFMSYYKGARVKDENSQLMDAIQNYSPASSTVYRFNGPASTSQSPTGVAKVLSGLVEIGLVGIKPEELPKLLPQDRMEPALKIMADVRAYFQVAYKRFVDNVPLAIDQELVRGIERDILPTLTGGLGIHGPDGIRICRDLSQESPNIAGRREELMKKLERLEKASEELLRVDI